MTELADRLQLAQSTVTELVRRAEETGLVAREQSPDDARVAHLRLTSGGRPPPDAVVHRALHGARAVPRRVRAPRRAAVASGYGSCRAVGAAGPEFVPRSSEPRPRARARPEPELEPDVVDCLDDLAVLFTTSTESTTARSRPSPQSIDVTLAVGRIDRVGARPAEDLVGARSARDARRCRRRRRGGRRRRRRGSCRCRPCRGSCRRSLRRRGTRPSLVPTMCRPFRCGGAAEHRLGRVGHRDERAVRVLRGHREPQRRAEIGRRRV